MLLSKFIKHPMTSPCCAALILCLFVPSVGWAKSTKKDKANQSSQAADEKTPAQKRLVKRISTALEDEEYSNAIKLMERLYKSYPKVSVLYNMAIAYEKQKGACEGIIGAYDRFFSACEGCAQEAKAKKRRSALKDRCGPAKVSIESSGPAMSLTVDGTDRGTTPTQLELNPGAHTLKLSDENGAQVIQTLNLAPNSEMNLNVSAQESTGPVARMNTIEKTGWWLVGAGIVSLGTGAVFASLEADEKSEANKDLAVAWEAKGMASIVRELEFEELAIEHKDKADQHGAIAMGALGAGSLMLISGAAIAIWGRTKASKLGSTVKITPMPTGLAISGEL